jgi:hypothetical protein
MSRVWCLVSFLSIAACISYPVTNVGEARDASVSPDGSAQPIALEERFVDESRFDAGAEDEAPTDGGVLPHPERDAEPGDDERPKGKPPRNKKL